MPDIITSHPTVLLWKDARVLPHGNNPAVATGDPSISLGHSYQVNIPTPSFPPRTDIELVQTERRALVSGSPTSQSWRPRMLHRVVLFSETLIMIDWRKCCKVSPDCAWFLRCTCLEVLTLVSQERVQYRFTSRHIRRYCLAECHWSP